LNPKALPNILLLGLLWGSTLVGSRFGVGQFTPVTFVGIRFVFTSLIFILVYIFKIGNRTWPKGKEMWTKGAIMGLGNIVETVGIVTSLHYLSSGLVSIMLTVGPAFTVLLAHFFLDDERMNLRKVNGIIIALIGAVLLIILGESGLPDVNQANPIGYVLVLGGIFSASVMTIYARKFMQDCDSFDVTSVRMYTCALVVMPLSLLLEGFDLSNVNGNGVLALIYTTVIGQFLGMILSLDIIQKFGATASVMTSYVIPVVAGLIGVILLDEHITWGMLASISFIILGVSVINSSGRQKPTLP